MSLPAQVVVDGNSLTIESLVAVARRRPGRQSGGLGANRAGTALLPRKRNSHLRRQHGQMLYPLSYAPAMPV